MIQRRIVGFMILFSLNFASWVLLTFWPLLRLPNDAASSDKKNSCQISVTTFM